MGAPHERRMSLVVVTLLVLHVVLLAWGAARHSPTWDEWGHLSAGLGHWHLRRFDLYRVNPPLVRLIASFPVLFLSPKMDWPPVCANTRLRGEFATVSLLARYNRARTLWLFWLARFSCIPFSVLGGYICFRWSSDLYGSTSGVLAVFLWCFSPNILAHGQMITPDMGATALGVTASYVFWRWLKKPTWRRSFILGLLLGATELSKFTWIVMAPLWVALWVVWSLSGAFARRRSFFLQSAMKLSVTGIISLFVIHVGYFFESPCPRLDDLPFCSRAMIGRDLEYASGVQSTAGLSKVLPMSCRIPLPANYVLGIDRQKYDFESGSWSFLGGEWRHGGWWYYYIYAAAVKVPLGIWCLGFVIISGSVMSNRLPHNRRDELILLAPAIVVLVFVSSQTGFSHHFRYVLPCYPYIVVWLSKTGRFFEQASDPTSMNNSQSGAEGSDLGQVECGLVRSCHHGNCEQRSLIAGLWRRLCAAAFCRPPVGRAIVVMALTWTAASSMSTYPHSLSYFNEVVGGPRNGHLHLLGSNLDWGQDLLFLTNWMSHHPEMQPLGLSYSIPKRMLDPNDLGFQFVDYSSAECSSRPSLREGGYGPSGVNRRWLAIFASSLYDHDGTFADFRSIEPAAIVGYTVRVYCLDELETSRTHIH